MHSSGVETTDVSGGLFPQHRCSGQVSGNQEKKFLGWGHCLLTNCSNNSPNCFCKDKWQSICP